jgi:hypothetical protein
MVRYLCDEVNPVTSEDGLKLERGPGVKSIIKHVDD